MIKELPLLAAFTVQDNLHPLFYYMFVREVGIVYRIRPCPEKDKEKRQKDKKKEITLVEINGEKSIKAWNQENLG